MTVCLAETRLTDFLVGGGTNVHVRLVLEQDEGYVVTRSQTRGLYGPEGVARRTPYGMDANKARTAFRRKVRY